MEMFQINFAYGNNIVYFRLSNNIYATRNL